MIDWIVIKDEHDSQGTFTHQIKWIPPTRNGFIVQRVEVVDPYKLLTGYEKPYYEAWKVKQGEICYYEESYNEYDDSFSNCWNGDSFGIEIAKETFSKKMEIYKKKTASVKYNCLVYWIEENSISSQVIQNWKRGEEIGIMMAGKLKASYEAPPEIGEGIKRNYSVEFVI